MYRGLARQRHLLSVTSLPTGFSSGYVRTDLSRLHINSRRSILGMSRLPLKLESQRQRGKADFIQKVGLRGPTIRFRNIAISLAVTFIAWQVYIRLVFGALADGLAEIEPAEDLEEVPRGVFIPFPGTTVEVMPPPYRGSDPEWQEFIKFANDQKLAQSVRNELAALVVEVANKNRLLTLKVGRGLKFRRYWLDVDFPSSPPPQFVRSGVELFGDDYLIGKWTTEPVDSLIVFATRRALWPSALTLSMWSFSKTLVLDDISRCMNFFAPKSDTQSTALEQILARHQQLVKGSKDPAKDVPAPSVLSSTSPSNSVPVRSSETMGGERPNAPRRHGQPRTEESFKLATELIESVNPHIFRPIMAFRSKILETWRPLRDYPPRGSIIVSGLVEVDAPSAWIVVDVKAAWDPQTRSYDPRSMHMGVRRIQAKKQGPKGGP